MTGQMLSKIRWICIPLNSTFIWLMRVIVLWQDEWQQQEQQQWQNQIRSFRYALLDAWSRNLNQMPKDKLVQGNTRISVRPCVYLPSSAQNTHFHSSCDPAELVLYCRTAAHRDSAQSVAPLWQFLKIHLVKGCVSIFRHVQLQAPLGPGMFMCIFYYFHTKESS